MPLTSSHVHEEKQTPGSTVFVECAAHVIGGEKPEGSLVGLNVQSTIPDGACAPTAVKVRRVMIAVERGVN
jgi:hypothetical protein